jgi:hypothetical protein
MKHLKLYEKLNSSNEYYRKITTDEYQELDNKYLLVAHSDYEIKQIESIIKPKLNPSRSISLVDFKLHSFLKSSPRRKVNIIQCKVGSKDISIYKYDDEFFLIMWNMSYKPFAVDRDILYYYLCDQLHGVKELLTDLLK